MILNSEGIKKNVFVTGNTIVDSVLQNIKIAEEKSNIIECLLFTSAKPLKADEIARVTSWNLDDIQVLLDELVFLYQDRGVRVRKVAEGYQMVTFPSAAAFIEKLHHQQLAQSLTRAALEVLAIIAYRQPITRVKIASISK